MVMAENKNNPFSFVNPVLGSAMDFAVNNAMAGLASGRQFGYSRKMFDYTFAQQNQRQDWLNANSALIQKQSLKNAGLSASNLNGTPFSANVATGSGLTGSAEFAQMNMLSNMLQAKQVDIQDKMADAEIAKMDAETQKITKETSWIDVVNQANVDAQNSISKLNLGNNERAEKLLQPQIDEITANIKLTESNTSLNNLVKDANEKMYNFEGRWVKGSEIPNFEKLVTLDIAKKTLQVAQENAKTNRMSVTGDPMKQFMNQFVNPLVGKLKQYFGSEVNMLVYALENLDKLIPSLVSEDSHTEVGGEPVE